jgi:hypothetical protein
MSLYDTIAPIRAAITTQRLKCQRCHREIVAPIGDSWAPCHHCRAELGECTGDAQTSVMLRHTYDGATAWERLTTPRACTLLALTSDGYLVTHEGEPRWTRAMVFDGGVAMRRTRPSTSSRPTPCCS